MKEPLTEQEENLLKDILKAISNDNTVMDRITCKLNADWDDFDKQLDVIFNKLQNGRVTVETE